MKTKYPECEKLSAVSGESQKIGDFLNWLFSEDYYICEFDNEEEVFFESSKRIQDYLAEYFDIDMDKVEEERRQILLELRGDE